jgi:uncharacterized membrane protein YfcA
MKSQISFPAAGKIFSAAQETQHKKIGSDPMTDAIPELLKMCLIVCPLVFLAGFVDAVAGGGGLISLPAYLLAGLPAHQAAATNKTVNCMGTALAAWQYGRSKKVLLRAALYACIGSTLGSYIGTRLALWIPDAVLGGIMVTALPCVAVFLSVNKGFGLDAGAKKQLSRRGEALLSFGIGIFIGCYDGLIGPGTGTFLILAFTGLMGMDLLTSSGCAKFANLASNITSMVVYLIGGKVVVLLAIPAAVCCMLGSFFGSRYALRGGSKNVRRVMFVVLGLLFVKILVSFFQ